MDIKTEDVVAAVQAGRESVGAAQRVTMVAVNGISVPVSTNGIGVQVMQAALDAADSYQPGPRRRQLAVTLTELDSFNGYVNRHKDALRSVIYADTKTCAVVCVLDDHSTDEVTTPAPTPNGWRGHRALYGCPLSPEWERWRKQENVRMNQVAFGDFVDANLLDLTSSDGFPSPGEVLQMARSLQVNVGSRYKREVNRTTGEGSLISESEHTAESTKIPRAFALGLRVFEGGEQHLVEARLRFSMEGGAPVFTYELYRAEETKRDAFIAIREAVKEATKLPVFAGTPG